VAAAVDPTGLLTAHTLGGFAPGYRRLAAALHKEDTRLLYATAALLPQGGVDGIELSMAHGLGLAATAAGGLALRHVVSGRAGDALGPRSLEEAVLEGVTAYRAARAAVVAR
jgi:hypothetical protein